MARRIIATSLSTRAFHYHPPPGIMALTSSSSSGLTPFIRSLKILTLNGDDRGSTGACPVKTETMDSSPVPSYGDAVRALNSLQTNSENIQEAILKRSRLPVESPEKISTQNVGLLQDGIKYLERGGLSMTQLDSLNFIHVSGTKGKGTTCAFVESILRQAGFRTGFFSSPHLVSVRERIRINGKPLSQDKFTQYFFEVYNRLTNAKESESDMPPYFRFLTCLCFYALYHEKVDVAIMEVGIGGALDPTNIIRKPVVTGITSLGMEHVRILGDTLEKIAYQKAGIMKRHVPAFTVDSHPPQALKVLQQYADTVQCPLFIVPALETYGEALKLGVDDGRVSRINAALGLQLATAFLADRFPEKVKYISGYQHGKPWPLAQWHVKGLENCTWHGRFQILSVKDSLTYYLDGAHTKDSLEAARNWFHCIAPDNSFRVLIFHVTGDRSAEELIKTFTGVEKVFHLAIFCPLAVSTSRRSPSADNWSALQAGKEEMTRCYKLCETWMNLMGSKSRGMTLESVDQVLSFLDRISKDFPGFNGNSNGTQTSNEDQLTEHKNVSVLITGSLHLVGTYLSLLDPDLASK